MSSVLLLFLAKGACAAYMGLHCSALSHINGCAGGKQKGRVQREPVPRKQGG